MANTAPKSTASFGQTILQSIYPELYSNPTSLGNQLSVRARRLGTASAKDAPDQSRPLASAVAIMNATLIEQNELLRKSVQEQELQNAILSHGGGLGGGTGTSWLGMFENLAEGAAAFFGVKSLLKGGSRLLGAGEETVKGAVTKGVAAVDEMISSLGIAGLTAMTNQAEGEGRAKVMKQIMDDDPNKDVSPAELYKRTQSDLQKKNAPPTIPNNNTFQPDLGREIARGRALSNLSSNPSRSIGPSPSTGSPSGPLPVHKSSYSDTNSNTRSLKFVADSITFKSRETIFSQKEKTVSSPGSSSIGGQYPIQTASYTRDVGVSFGGNLRSSTTTPGVNVTGTPNIAPPSGGSGFQPPMPPSGGTLSTSAPVSPGRSSHGPARPAPTSSSGIKEITSVPQNYPPVAVKESARGISREQSTSTTNLPPIMNRSGSFSYDQFYRDVATFREGNPNVASRGSKLTGVREPYSNLNIGEGEKMTDNYGHLCGVGVGNAVGVLFGDSRFKTIGGMNAGSFSMAGNNNTFQKMGLYQPKQAINYSEWLKKPASELIPGTIIAGGSEGGAQHIQMWDGHRWISDTVQSGMYLSPSEQQTAAVHIPTPEALARMPQEVVKNSPAALSQLKEANIDIDKLPTESQNVKAAAGATDPKAPAGGKNDTAAAWNKDNTYVIGDSWGVGIKGVMDAQGSALTRAQGTALTGANPTQVLGMINGKPQKTPEGTVDGIDPKALQGKNIVLSPGLLNGTDQVKQVRDQISALNKLGVTNDRIKLVSPNVSPNVKDKNLLGVHDDVDKIAKDLGIDTISNDPKNTGGYGGYHPSDYSPLVSEIEKPPPIQPMAKRDDFIERHLSEKPIVSEDATPKVKPPKIEAEVDKKKDAATPKPRPAPPHTPTPDNQEASNTKKGSISSQNMLYSLCGDTA